MKNAPATKAREKLWKVYEHMNTTLRASFIYLRVIYSRADSLSRYIWRLK